MPLVDPYSQYNFCNPSEMFPKLAEYKSGDQLLVSGLAYWNCTYLNQVSNSYYGSPQERYMMYRSLMFILIRTEKNS